MKGKKRIIVVSVLVFVLTVLEAFMIKGVVGAQEKVKVYIATKNIDLGEMISSSNASEMEVSSDLISPEAISSIGGRLYATRPIYKYEQIAQSNTSSQLPQLVRKGFVHMGLVPEASNAVVWQLKKGDRVNINCLDEKNKSVDFNDILVIGVIDETFKEAFTDKSVGNPKFLVVELTEKQATDFTRIKRKGFYTVNKTFSKC